MSTLYVGLDVHKLIIAISTAQDGRGGPVEFLGEIPNTPTDLAKLAKRLARDGDQLEFCYEAGCCGYGIYRQGSARLRMLLAQDGSPNTGLGAHAFTSCSN